MDKRVFFCNASFLQILTNYFQKEVGPNILKKKKIHINSYFFHVVNFCTMATRKKKKLKYFVVVNDA